jgi:hypothetical protein
MQQVVEDAYTKVTTADISQEVKRRLGFSLERLEKAVMNYQQRNIVQRGALVAELDGYLGQLKEIIGEES